MELTSQRLMMGAAGSGSRSYAINVQPGVLNDLRYAYDPVTDRTAFVYTYSDSTSIQQPSVVVYDSNWNKVFSKAYTNSGVSGLFRFNACQFDLSGNLFATGYGSSTGATVPLFKWNTSGSLTLSNEGYYFTSGEGRSIATDSSGVYIASTNPDSLLLTKTNTSGSILWNKTLVRINSGIRFTWAPSKVFAKGSFVYTFGRANQDEFDSSSYGAGVTKWDTSGNLSWAALTGGNRSEYFGGYVDDSGNIYAAGMALPAGVVGKVVKLNSSGAEQWNLQATSDSLLADVTVNESTGDVYISGYRYNAAGSKFVTWVIKTNSSGTVQWQRRFSLLTNGVTANTGTINTKIDIKSNGILRIYAASIDSTITFRTTNIIEYDPVEAPTGTYVDPFVYSGPTSYSWFIDAPTGGLNSVANSTGLETVTVANAANGLQALPASTETTWANSIYGRTQF